jgi:hypothetical protein
VLVEDLSFGSGLIGCLLTGCNVGYAFVNFIHVQDLLRFAKARLGVKWYVFYYYYRFHSLISFLGICSRAKRCFK